MTDSPWVRDLDPTSDADIQAAIVIFRQAYEDCWDERFLRRLLKKNHRALLAGSGDLACGCLVYRHFRSERDILGIGVLRDAMRLGYGTALLQELKSRMLQERLPCTVVTYVPPDNVVGQRLFQKLDFQWVWTEPDFGGQGPLRIFRWIPTWPGECGESSSRSKSMD